MYGLAAAATLLIKNQTYAWQNPAKIYYTDDSEEKERRDKIMKEIYALSKELARRVEIMEKIVGDPN